VPCAATPHPQKLRASAFLPDYAQTLGPKKPRIWPRRARAWFRRDLAATAALFARSIDRHLAQHDLTTSRAAPAASKGVTLSDGEGQGERAPTRRSARRLERDGIADAARRSG
jgi:hypothetical protein